MSDQRDLAILALQKQVLDLREQLAAEKDAREEAEAARRADNGETWEDECMRAHNQRDAAIARAEGAERIEDNVSDALRAHRNCGESYVETIDRIVSEREAVAPAFADQDRLAEAERKLAECAASHDSLLGQVNMIALAVDLTIEASFAIILDRVKTLRCRAKEAEAEAPVPVILHCPACKKQHLDEGEWETRPHKRHRCVDDGAGPGCGFEWRANAFRPTVGVAFNWFEG